MATTEEDETGYILVKKQYEYGYAKVGNNQAFIPKTSWCLSTYGYVSGPELEGIHKIAFKCYTKQDKKVFTFNYVRTQVMKHVVGSFIFGELNQKLW